MNLSKIKYFFSNSILILAMSFMSACSKKGSSARFSNTSVSNGGSSVSSGQAVQLAISFPSNQSWVNSTTDSSTFFISGTCVGTVQSKLNGQAVTIKEGTAVLGSSTCESGTFGISIDTTALTEGEHALVVHASDSDGKAGTSEAVTIKRDVTQPSLSLVSGPTNASVTSLSTTAYTLTFSDTNLGVLSNSEIDFAVTVTGDSKGCFATASGSSSTERTVTISGCNDTGTASISIDGSLLHDSAGNSMNVVTGPYSTFSISNSGPTISITSPVTNGWVNASDNAASYSVQGTCSASGENVSISIDNGAVTGAATCNGSLYSGTVDVSSLSAGNHLVEASVSSAGQTAMAKNRFGVDTVVPVLTISNPRIASVNSSIINSFTLTFTDTNGNGLNPSTINSAITLNGGGAACTKTVNVMNTTTAVVTISSCSGDGSPTITVGAAAWSDKASNQMSAETSNSFVVDNTAPVLAITSPITGSFINPANNSTTFAVSGTCSENSKAVSLTVNGGAALSMGNCSSGTFSGTIDTTTIAIGSVVVVASQRDSTNNLGSSSGVNLNKLSSQATLTLATAVNPTVKSSGIQITATFSDDVTDFDISDISVTGGTASNLTGSGKNYAFEIAPSSASSQANILVSIAASAAVDINNNPTAAATDLSVSYYPAPSSLTGTSPGTTNTPVVTVGNGVSGLVANIFSDSACTTLLGSSTMSASSVTITSDAIASSTTYYARFSDGTNDSSCSTASFSYVLNSPRPTVSITSTNSSIPTTQAAIPMTVTFSTDVTGYTDSGITVTNGTVSNFSSSSGSVYTFDFNPTIGGSGTFTIDVPENVAQDGIHQNFAAATFSREYYRATPVVTRTPASTNDTTPDLTVSNLINGLTANLYSDAACSSSVGSVPTSGSTAVVTSSTISSDTTYYADVTDGAGNKSACSSGFSLTLDSSAPVNATSLAWTGGAASSSTSLPITWVKSTDAQLANQKVQFHSGAGCSSALNLIDLGSATQQSYTYTAPSASSYSFQIISTDVAGNSNTSSCSGTMTVSLTAVSLSPASFAYPAGQALTVNFIASGGGGGNIFSIDSGSGSINASTGVFTGGNSRVPGTTTVIRVTDSVSSTATVTINHTAAVVNGTVYASATDGTSMYLGGSFSLANYVTTKALIGVDGSSNQILDYRISSRFNSGAIIKAVLVSNGFAFVGGSFTSYNGTTVQNLAKINLSTGALDTTFTQTTGPNNAVNALAMNGSALYIGGSFTGYRALSGNNYKYLLKLDSTSGALDTAFVPTFGTYSGNVYALHLANSAIYAGGDFSGTNGVTTGSTLIKVNLSTGASTGLYGLTSAPGPVYAITSQSGFLFVGGALTGWKVSSSLSASYKYLIKVDWNSGVLDSTFNLANNYPNNAANTNGTVRALAISGTSLYVGGEFELYRGDAKGAYLAKVSASTGVLDTTSFNNQASNSGPDSTVYSIATSTDGSGLYVGGAFSSYRGNSVGKKLVKVNSTTGVLDTANFHASSQVFDNNVNAIAVSDSTVYAGGAFASRGTPVQNLVKYNLSNWSVDTSFTQASGANNTVRAVALNGANVYVGGDFTSYRGDTKGLRLVKLDSTTGNMDTVSFNATAANGPNGIVHSILVNGTELYIAGAFTNYRGSNSGYRMAKLNALTGAMNTTFNSTGGSGPDSTVYALAFNSDKTKIYMGGAFTAYRSSSYCSRLCVILTSDGSYNSIFQANGAPTDGAVYALALSGSNLFVGGTFTQYNYNTKSAYLAKINAANGALDTASFNSSTSNHPNNAVNTISISADGSYVYAGGAFTTYNSSAVGAYLVKVNSATAVMETANFNTSAANVPGGIVYSTLLSSDGSKLYVGGSHTTYRGDSTTGYATSVSTTNGAASW